VQGIASFDDRPTKWVRARKAYLGRKRNRWRELTFPGAKQVTVFKGAPVEGDVEGRCRSEILWDEDLRWTGD
jgi:hypothetical protein